MKHLAVISLTISVSSLAAAPAMAQSGAKPGLWELRAVKQMVDGKDMAAQMTAATEQVRAAVSKMSSE